MKAKITKDTIGKWATLFLLCLFKPNFWAGYFQVQIIYPWGFVDKFQTTKSRKSMQLTNVQKLSII